MRTRGPQRRRGSAAVALALLVAASPGRAEQLPLRAYGTDGPDGLPDVNCIVSDSWGFLWFCSAEGLSRFDGDRFVHYRTNEAGLPAGNVNDLLDTRRGTYWVATATGLYRFDPGFAPDALGAAAQQPLFTAQRPFGWPPGKDLPVLDLYEDRAGTVWCGTAAGLFRIVPSGSGEILEAVALEAPGRRVPSVRAILEDRSKALWVGGSGLWIRTPDSRWHGFEPRGRNAERLEILDLLEDRAGRMWAATGTGIYRLLVSPGPSAPRVVARHHPTRGGPPFDWARVLYETRDGRLWAGTEAGLRERPASADDSVPFRMFGTAAGGAPSNVYALTEDGDGNLWIGTQWRGAIKFARQGFTRYGAQEGVSDPHLVLSIVEDRDGRLCAWMSARSSRLHFCCFDGQRFVRVEPRLPKHLASDGRGWNQVVFQDRRREWWIPTGDGLYRFPPVDRPEDLARIPPKAVYTQRDGLPGRNVFRLFEDSRGNLWIATTDRTGLAIRERASGRLRVFTQADGLPPLRGRGVHAFAEEPSGAVWIGMMGALVRYAAGRFRVFSKGDGLPDTAVLDLLVDRRGRLWIATLAGGLVRVDEPAAERPHFIGYGVDQRLSSTLAHCIAEDRWGRIYVGTRRGVDRLDPDTNRIWRFTSKDGLMAGFVTAAFTDREGALWFGSTYGLARLVPQPDEPRPPPRVLITDLQIAGVNRPVAALGVAEAPRLILGPDQNRLQVGYVAPGFATGDVLLYSYRLEGTGEPWSAWTEQRFVHYASLPSGSYRFQVRARSADASESGPPAAVAFTVLAPVWRRGWFLTCAVVLVGLAVHGWQRARERRRGELEGIRRRISADLHDDVGASLSQLAVWSEVARRRVCQDPELRRILGRIGGMAAEAMEAMADAVWAIDPRKDSLADLARRARRFTSDSLAARGIDLKFHAPAADALLAPDLRRQAYLFLKEAVNNAARHAACRGVEIELSLCDGHLLVAVSDDGRGFDVSGEHDGNGLPNLRRRAEALGGSVEIASALGRGTRLTLRMPLARRRRLASWSDAVRGRRRRRRSA